MNTIKEERLNFIADMQTMLDDCARDVRALDMKSSISLEEHTEQIRKIAHKMNRLGTVAFNYVNHATLAQRIANGWKPCADCVDGYCTMNCGPALAVAEQPPAKFKPSSVRRATR